MSRAMELDSFHQLLECARARLFRRQNGRVFFPPLPIAALLPRSWRWADSKKSQLGCYSETWLVLQHKKRA